MPSLFIHFTFKPLPIFFLTLSSLLFFTCYSIDEQGRALLSWKKTLNNSATLSSWNSDDPNPCKWFGITCNLNSQVTSIILKSVDLQGSLPSNLQSLKSLKTLVLSSTNITGTIPKEFGEYKDLALLDLSKNQIFGEIPDELCKLSRLEELILNTNSLQGPIPAGIGNLSSLSTLILFDNELSGEIPPSIGMLQKLEVFRAGGNQNIKGSLPPEIGNCSNLVMLGLADTGISGSLPASIGMLNKLETLAIYTALLSGPIPKEIGNCTELTTLYLYQNSLSGKIPPEIGQLRNLQVLLLWQNNLVGPIPTEIGDCKELTLIDLSLNLLSGKIPASIGKLVNLQQLQLSTNQITGAIPSEISDCTALTDIELDNNQLSGEISIDFTKMENLTLFFAWQNRLTGNIPVALASCLNLQSVDLSYNNLTGSIPRELLRLQNLTKLLLISNELSGFIPPDIGNCINLFRLRLNGNQLSGAIPAEIGNLKNLNFLDMSNNRLVGRIPPAITGCETLQFLDLHSNGLTGALPDLFPKSLQFIDVSDNQLTGPLSSGIGALSELTKLDIGKNQLFGGIPSQISSCSKLQLLDLGDNNFSGDIPPELGQLPALEISLNISCNRFSGSIPAQFSGLLKLGNLDISHNMLSGGLDALTNLENLVSLNISYNDFSGELPNTQFFSKLPLSDLAGNRGLLISGEQSLGADRRGRGAVSALKLTISLLVSVAAALMASAACIILRNRNGKIPFTGDKWEITMYQKLDISVDEVLKSLTSSNVIGTGSSGVVYKVRVSNGDTVAVKKLWTAEDNTTRSDQSFFWNEVSALGSIRHRNIVRLLGWCSSSTTSLLFYSYYPNGSLSSYLHRSYSNCGGKYFVEEWERRYEIAIGVAHAVAYLHHDCVPAILHGDIKAMNVLLGPGFEPYLADFGLARILNGVEQKLNSGAVATTPPQHIAGSYGYIAPEYGSMQRITDKSDVYSYGVVLLEILTGRHPLDPSLPDGAHLVQWVRDHLHQKGDPRELLDSRLRGRPDNQVQEMVQTIAISALCLQPRPGDRPTMKDVVALLKEIRRPAVDEPKQSLS